MSTDRRCECAYHLYHVVHVVAGDDRVYDHSQGTWDGSLRRLPAAAVTSYPSSLYRDGMTAGDLRLEHAARLVRAGREAAEAAYRGSCRTEASRGEALVAVRRFLAWTPSSDDLEVAARMYQQHLARLISVPWFCP